MALTIAHRHTNTPERLERRIAHRWLFWIPWATRFIRWNYPMHYVNDHLPRLKNEHRERILAILRKDLPWTTIRRKKLDDPLISYTEFQANLLECVVSGYRGKKVGVIRTRKEKDAILNSR